MINAPRVPTNVMSKYGPIIVPNNFAELFFEKAVIGVLGGTEIEPSTQTHQTLKLEDALYKFNNGTELQFEVPSRKIFRIANC